MNRLKLLIKAGVGGLGGVSSTPGATTATPQEYYGMQYPACYSPATQGYAQYSSMMGAAATGAAPTQDYTPPSSTATARRSPSATAPAPTTNLAPLTQNNVVVNNCKYADSNVGSPQDLSTTSSGGTPQPGAGGMAPKSPESDLEEPTSPLSPSPSGGGSSSGTKKEGDVKSNPPQIYPWMKRVHLGQSKCNF